MHLHQALYAARVFQKYFGTMKVGEDVPEIIALINVQKCNVFWYALELEFLGNAKMYCK